MDTHYLKRDFSYSIEENCYTPVCSLEHVYYLCDEGLKKGKRFTGAMHGMYAYLPKEMMPDENTPVYACFESYI